MFELGSSTLSVLWKKIYFTSLNKFMDELQHLYLNDEIREEKSMIK